MFRYIGLAWDSTVPSHATTAMRLCAELQRHSEWQSVVRIQGLRVFVTGARKGINGTYRLADQGVIVGRIFRRAQLGRQLAEDVTLTAQEVELILHGDRRTLVRDFWGRYVAITQSASGTANVLRDPSGTLPCFKLQHAGVSIVFSWLEDVLTHLPSVPRPQVEWDGVLAQVVMGALAGPATALDGITQVLPGQLVRLDGRPDSATLLWDAAVIAGDHANDDVPTARDKLRHTVRACTRSWANCYDSLLFRLSGGVDSSILLSCLEQGDTSARVTCVNYHSPGADSDERTYARLAAQRASRVLIERERDSAFRLDRVLMAARMPTPTNYVGRMTAQTDAQLAAQHGATALFTGGGGDQLFFEFATWWPAADYLHLRGIDGGFARAAMDAARLARVSVWKATALAFGESHRPIPANSEFGRHLALVSSHAVLPTSQQSRYLHPTMLRQPDLPVGKLTQMRHLIHPIGYYDPYEIGDAPELVNPLLSQPLVELCLKIPTYVLAHGGRGRALARQAFAQDIPKEIASRRAKGGMEELIKHVLVSNLEFARSILLDGQLVQRGIIDRSKVEAALSDKPTTVASHIGEIHRYIGIEAWLKKWPALMSSDAS